MRVLQAQSKQGELRHLPDGAAAEPSADRPERGSVITIGAFDGLHIGHRSLIRQVISRAQDLDCASAVITFDRHPASVVRPESAPPLLTDLDQKLELIGATGVDYTLVVPFDEARAQEEAEDFIDEVLIDRLGARAIVIGHDFHFGRGRRGDAEMLDEIGKSKGFEVIEPAVVMVDDVVVSSTAIRAALDEGRVQDAAVMLGRPHEVRGLVIMGDGRGRELGYPTANIHIPSTIKLPADGVYAGTYSSPDGKEHPAAISLGTRPTFYDNGDQLLEVHLIDFSGDLYGQNARVRFTHRIRGQERFDSVEALVKKMAQDTAAAQRMLANK